MTPGTVRLPEFFVVYRLVNAWPARSSLHSYWSMTLALPSPVRLPEFFAAFLLVEDAWFARTSQAARILFCVDRRLPCRDQSARASSKPRPPSRRVHYRGRARAGAFEGRRQNLLPVCDLGAQISWQQRQQMLKNFSLFSMFSHMYVSGRGNQKKEEEKGERARERGDA